MDKTTTARAVGVDGAPHAWPAGDVLASLGVTLDGLADNEITRRRARFGANTLPREKRKSVFAVYINQFRSPFIYFLLLAAVISLAVAEYEDAAFIVIVLQLNAAIGGYQEWTAQARAMALQSMIEHDIAVRRDGERRRVASADLVPGDIVYVETGVHVPADLRLVSDYELQADESLLTGESTPVAKLTEAALPVETAIAERGTMLHAGTSIVHGRAIGVVTATAMTTQLGRIARAMLREAATEPPLLGRMRDFTRTVTIAMVGLIALLAAAELARGAALLEIVLVGVALAVAAIPEGLPVAMTVALSVAVSRMARRNVIVRLLPAVEGLGACTLIASDKTGTLTRNELRVRRAFLPGLGEVDIEDAAAPAAQAETAGQALPRLLLAAALCNEASVEQTDGDRVYFGDSVDVALLRAAHDHGVDAAAIAAAGEEIARTPFEAHRRFAATIHRHAGTMTAYVKGASETVLPMCEAASRSPADVATAQLAAQGYRVLALAAGPASGVGADGRHDGSFAGLTFLGLIGLIDPLRPEAAVAVRQCRDAGVTVCMVTGDHPLTALTIARDLGIAATRDDVVNGAEIAACGGEPAALEALARRATVFARVEPLQKQALVAAFQRIGHLVAVTGDGVNDAPALNAADIGVAMGRGGTDIARGAADLILTDDNFASIVAGIDEGRIAYDNVRKVIWFVIATGMAEIVLFVLTTAAGLPLPLGAVQLLWLNLVTSGIQDVALAFEQGEPGVLARPPRPPRQAIFDRRMIAQVAVCSLFGGAMAFGFYDWALAAGWDEVPARNGVLLLLLVYANALALSCRSETRSIFAVPLRANPVLIFGVLGAQAVHVGAMYTPGLNAVLEIAPIAPAQWLPIAALGAAAIVVTELYKMLLRQLAQAGHAAI